MAKAKVPLDKAVEDATKANSGFRAGASCLDWMRENRWPKSPDQLTDPSGLNPADFVFSVSATRSLRGRYMRAWLNVSLCADRASMSRSSDWSGASSCPSLREGCPCSLSHRAL